MRRQGGGGMSEDMVAQPCYTTLVAATALSASRPMARPVMGSAGAAHWEYTRNDIHVDNNGAFAAFNVSFPPAKHADVIVAGNRDRDGRPIVPPAYFTHILRLSSKTVRDVTEVGHGNRVSIRDLCGTNVSVQELVAPDFYIPSSVPASPASDFPADDRDAECYSPDLLRPPGTRPQPAPVFIRTPTPPCLELDDSGSETELSDDECARPRKRVALSPVKSQ